MRKKEQAENIFGNLCFAVRDLEGCKDFSLLIPEVRVNIVYAMPGAASSKEVAAVEGRVTVVKGYPRASGLPAWGASDHMARLVLAARKHNNRYNAGINFKCDEEIIAVVKQYAEKKDLRFGWIDRTKEPEEAAAIDGKSILWKVKYLVAQYGEVPDLFYEGDGWGKEPLFFALGSNAVKVVKMAKEIAAEYRRKMHGRK